MSGFTYHHKCCWNKAWLCYHKCSKYFIFANVSILWENINQYIYTSDVFSYYSLSGASFSLSSTAVFTHLIIHIFFYLSKNKAQFFFNCQSGYWGRVPHTEHLEALAFPSWGEYWGDEMHMLFPHTKFRGKHRNMFTGSCSESYSMNLYTLLES